MNYPRIVIEHDALRYNQRVYVRDLDVFGRRSIDPKYIICESPMPGYLYEITEHSILYHDAIGERDSQSDI